MRYVLKKSGSFSPVSRVVDTCAPHGKPLPVSFLEKRYKFFLAVRRSLSHLNIRRSLHDRGGQKEKGGGGGGKG